MLNFGVLEKGLGLASLSTFLYDFSREIFPVLYSINLPNSIVLLLLLLQILDNICVVIICFSVCDVISFEIGLSSLIKPFSHMTAKFRTQI